MEPDLEVIVGTALDGQEERFRYHSQVLAHFSDYVEAALCRFSNGTTKEIRFPDVAPALWKKAMEFLAPGGSLHMCVEDIAEVLPFYIQYQFRSGIRMCDLFIENMLKNDSIWDVLDLHAYYAKGGPRFEDLILACKLSLQHRLEESSASSKWFVASIFDHTMKWGSNYIDLEEDHVEFLMPFFTFEEDEDHVRTFVGSVIRARELEELEEYEDSDGDPEDDFEDRYKDLSRKSDKDVGDEQTEETIRSVIRDDELFLHDFHRFWTEKNRDY